ncbi:hypothetical protein HPB50_003697 [Hyalomma asiaticum]|uniref:Uncharacterized protein n=1 Tax=Hyalomma asiaticum TaxID=266040 RepID=A0ACB7SBG1_HYAAI|nr:hypothetical protein HPB50_003697 [Hyalomma asiaticum]
MGSGSLADAVETRRAMRSGRRRGTLPRCSAPSGSHRHSSNLVFLLAIAGIITSCDVCLGPFVINASSDTPPQSRSTFTPGMLDTPLQDLRMSVTPCATDSIKPLPQNFFTSRHGETAATMPLTKKCILAVQAFF